MRLLNWLRWFGRGLLTLTGWDFEPRKAILPVLGRDKVDLTNPGWQHEISGDCAGVKPFLPTLATELRGNDLARYFRNLFSLGHCWYFVFMPSVALSCWFERQVSFAW